MTLAVVGLLLITSDLDLDVRKMRRHWEVRILEEGAGESDIQMEDSDIDVIL